MNIIATLSRSARRLTTLLLTVPTFAVAQADEADELQTVDSLLTVFEQADKSQKVGVGRRLIDIYATANAFLEEQPVLRADIPDDSLRLLIHYATERFYLINAYYTEALQYNDRAQEGGSERHPAIHATLLCDRGYCLHKTGRTTEAAQAEQEAMRYCQQTGNTLQLSRAYLYLAIVNYGINEQEQAKDFILKAIETNRRLGVNQQTHNALGVASEIFCGAGEVDKAIDYGLQAVEAARAIGFDAGVANHLAQLSYAYDRNKQYREGFEAADSAIGIVKAMEIPDRNVMAVAYKFKGWNLLDMGRYAEAAEALEEAVALERQIGNIMGECYDMKAIAEALEPIDPRGAMRALRRYSTMADSIHTAQLHEALSQANASFRNDELQEQNAQERRTKRIILFGSLALVLMLAAIAAALWWASRQKSRANRALRQLQVARDNFFTNVTHEFRTPLTVILGMSQELQKAQPATAPPVAGALIERQGNQLLNLVNQLLDISKVSSAIGQQPTRTADLAAYVAMNVESLRELARQKGVRISYEATERPLVTDFVPDYMQKILSNLLTNAVKYTPEGGEVAVRLERQKSRILLSVADTGCGIAPVHLPHIFEPFYQTDPEAGTGTGVGLALVKQITEALQGKIDVTSTPGEGTKFEVSLPMRKRSGMDGKDGMNGENGHNGPFIASAASPASPSSPSSPVSPVSPSAPSTPAAPATPATPLPSSILVVEDNADVAYYIGSLLQSRYKVSIATDGALGLAMARELMPDLIVTDLMMPHTDGLELCRQIRADELTNHIPVIVITAKATDDDRLRGLEAGADAYLFKPFNADELYIRVEKLLEQRRLLHAKYARIATLETEEPMAQTEAETVSGTATGTATGTPSGSETPSGTAETAQVAEAVSSQRRQAEEQFLRKVKALVLQLMPDGNADIDHVASELCMSPSQFRRKLGAITGTTPAQYILHLRLEQSRVLLTEHSEWPIIEVAECCGFSDQPNFTRVFRRVYGITPGAARQEDAI